MFKKFALITLLNITSLFAYEVHIWDAKDYAENSLSQQTTAEYILEKFKFNGHEHILDVGSGDGKITAELSNQLPQGEIIGLDLSPNMVEFAKNRFNSCNYHNLKFIQGDACSIPYENSFDVIFSFTTLQWAKDHRQVIDGMHKALKSNGTIALSMPTGLPLTVQQAVDETIAKPEWRSFFTNFTTGFNFINADEYQKLLQEAGFQVNLIEKRAQKDLFENKEILQKFMSQWFPYLRPIPPALKQNFMSEVLDRYFELEGIDNTQGKPVYFFPTHLIIIAHKN